MIQSKKELVFYIAADRIMNGFPVRRGKIDQLMNGMRVKGVIINYLYAMRKAAYYSNTSSRRISLRTLLRYYWIFRQNKLGLKLGFTIGYNSLGYGVCIPHHGTIVVGESNRIGNYAVLHTCTCISDNGKVIGDALYLSTGAKITSKLILGNGITIGANSLVNKSCEVDNVLLAGMPANVIKTLEPWYIRDGFYDRIRLIEDLKESMSIS